MAAWLTCWFSALVVATSSAGELTFAEPTASAGTVYTGVPLTHRFQFQNTSSHVVQITQVHTHCGCSTPRLTQLIYQPGDKGVLDLDVLTLTQPAGPHTFSVHIDYAVEGVNKETEVLLQAVLISEMTIEPAKLVVPADHVDQHPFTLRETRPDPLLIVDARTSLPHVTVRMTDAKRDESGAWTRSLRLVVDPELPPGKHEARLDLYTTDQKYEHLQAPFVLVKQAANQVTFSPREVEINAPAGRALPSRVVVLRSQTPKEMQIGSITADHPAISARWAANDEGIIAVRVQVDHARLIGATLVFAHSHPSRPPQC